jgi:Na+/proline symporter
MAAFAMMIVVVVVVVTVAFVDGTVMFSVSTTNFIAAFPVLIISVIPSPLMGVICAAVLAALM